MLLRFAIAVTVLEVILTIAASVLVTYTEPPVAFMTETDLSDIGIKAEKHETVRRIHQNAPCYDTTATLANPAAKLYVSLRTDATPADFAFRRQREEANRGHPERGEITLINEPLPGEQGYAVRHRSGNSVRFEAVRLRGTDLLIVRVMREAPYDATESAMISKCELRARAVQEHLMFKMRWRD